MATTKSACATKCHRDGINATADVVAELERLGETGAAKVTAGGLYVQHEENSRWLFAGAVEDEAAAEKAIEEFFTR